MVFWHGGMHQVDFASRAIAVDGCQHAQRLAPEACQGYACTLRVWILFCSRVPGVLRISAPSLPLLRHQHAKKLVVMKHSVHRASRSFKTRALRCAHPPRRAHPVSLAKKLKSRSKSCRTFFRRK